VKDLVANYCAQVLKSCTLKTATSFPPEILKIQNFGQYLDPYSKLFIQEWSFIELTNWALKIS